MLKADSGPTELLVGGGAVAAPVRRESGSADGEAAPRAGAGYRRPRARCRRGRRSHCSGGAAVARWWPAGREREETAVGGCEGVA